MTRTAATRSSKLRWQSFPVGWGLLTRREKIQAIWLSLAILISSLFDMIALASVMPLVGLIVEPERIVDSGLLIRLSKWLGNPDLDKLIIFLAAASVSLLVLSTAMRVALNWVSLRYSARCQTRLARELAEMLVQAPYDWFLVHNSAALGRTIYSDVAVWGGRYLRSLIVLVNTVFTVSLAVLLVLMFAPLAGIVVLAIAATTAIGFLLWTHPKIKAMSALKRVNSEQMMVQTVQAIAGIKDVKLSSRERYFSTLIGSAFQKIADATADIAFWQAFSPAATILLGQIILIAVVFILWNKGAGVGEIAAQVALLILVASRFIPALNQLSGNITSLWEVFPFVENVSRLRRNLVSATAAISQADTARPLSGEWRRISMKNVAFRYRDSSEFVLRNIDLELEYGKSYVFTGPSGAGKSTLTDLILGLLRASQGEIEIDGQSLAAIEHKSWQKRLAYVPQDPFLIDDTLRANVAFGVPRNDVDDDWVRHCLKLANLEDLLDGLEEGLDTPLRERGQRFSGGQKQRIAIARALYNRPELLVLDEATSALDAQSEGAVQQAIDNLKGELTTVVVAHRLSTIRNSDTIFLLENGQIVGRGTFDELTATQPLFRRLTAMAPADEGTSGRSDIDEPGNLSG